MCTLRALPTTSLKGGVPVTRCSLPAGFSLVKMTLLLASRTSTHASWSKVKRSSWPSGAFAVAADAAGAATLPSDEPAAGADALVGAGAAAPCTLAADAGALDGSGAAAVAGDD